MATKSNKPKLAIESFMTESELTTIKSYFGCKTEEESLKALRKVELLFLGYELPPLVENACLLLALSLAEQHYENFKDVEDIDFKVKLPEKTPQGKFPDSLIWDLEKLIDEGMTQKDAIHHLQHVSKKLPLNYKPSSIEKEIPALRKEWKEFYRSPEEIENIFENVQD